MCGWCGSPVGACDIREFHNGATLLRLCPQCSQTELAQKMTERMPPGQACKPGEEVWEESSVDGLPGWMQVTALLVLVAFVAPLVIGILSRL